MNNIHWFEYARQIQKLRSVCYNAASPSNKQITCNNAHVSINLISNFPPIDFANNACWNSQKKDEAEKIHVKYAILLNFYIALLSELITTRKKNIEHMSKLSTLRLFSTKRTGAVYTFTRAPMAHKKHSRIQYRFVCYHLKMSSKQNTAEQFIDFNSFAVLETKNSILNAICVLDSNLSSTQRLRFSYLFMSSLNV